MTRNRKTAKDAGRRLETATAAYLAAMLNDDRIEVRARNGGKDRGDVGGVRSAHGARVVVECKDAATMTLGPWVREAEVERGNDDALAGLVVHKRRGVGLGLDVQHDAQDDAVRWRLRIPSAAHAFRCTVLDR